MRTSQRRAVVSSPLLLVIVAQIAGPLGLQGQTASPEPAFEITSPRPLPAVALYLEEQYGKPVTFEDPVWVWRGDVEVKGKDENAYMAQWLKSRRLVLPENLSHEKSPALNATLLESVLAAYHSQNSDGTRFKMIESRMGFHIVPVQYHNDRGVLVAASSLLDARVVVPAGTRMASEHLRALCAAITAATGTKVEPNGLWFDGYFAANAVSPPNGAAQLLPEQDRAKYTFVWGVPEMPAREALLKLLDASATTIRWSLLCQPSARPQDRLCVLNLSPLQVRENSSDGRSAVKTVMFDRVVRPAVGAPLPQAPSER